MFAESLCLSPCLTLQALPLPTGALTHDSNTSAHDVIEIKADR